MALPSDTASPAPRLRRRPSLNTVRAVLVPAVVLIALNLDRGYQTDFWHHLARGRAIAQSGRLADVDQSTFTVAGTPLRDANWLTQLAYYGLYQAGGLELVQFANAATLAAALGLLVWLCRRSGGSPGAAAATGVFVFLGLWQTLLIRPQTVSLLLFVVLLCLLHEARRRPWLLLFPPALMALWANVHGGFPIGLVLIGAHVAAAAVQKWWGSGGDSLLTPRPDHDNTPSPSALSACLIAGTLATLANPYGWEVYRYVLTLSNVAAGRGIEEWLPPGLGLWTGRAWATSVVVMLGLFAVSPRRPSARQWCVAACFLPLACESVRMVAWWLLAAAPTAAALLTATAAAAARRNAARGFADQWGDRSAKPRAARPSVAAAVAIVVLLGAAAFSLPWCERYNPLFSGPRDPRRVESDLQAAVDQLASRATHTRVFTRLEWGEYLAWSAAPGGVSVFMDGRIEIYPDDVWARYHAVTAARSDWQQVLDGYGVDALLLDATYHDDLLPRVRASGRWRECARSGPAVLFRRLPPAGGDRSGDRSGVALSPPQDF